LSTAELTAKVCSPVCLKLANAAEAPFGHLRERLDMRARHRREGRRRGERGARRAHAAQEPRCGAELADPSQEGRALRSLQAASQGPCGLHLGELLLEARHLVLDVPHPCVDAAGVDGHGNDCGGEPRHCG
jgi:hypothetical protein